MQYDDYFKNMFINIDNNVKLDKEQIKAILTDDKYSLIIAGAGSGKTTTVTAKVKYLVDKKNINPEDILIISLTNKAIDELKERINKQFKIPAKIITFHKLGMEIIRKKYKKINILTNQSIIINNYINDRFKNKELLKKFLTLFLPYFEEKKDDKLINLKNEYVKTEEEKIITDFLYLNNVNYEYLPFSKKGAIKVNKYYIKTYKNKIVKYLESKIYKNTIQIDNIEELQKKLKINNIKLNLKNEEEIINLIKNNNSYIKFINFCITFLNNFKNRGFDERKIRKIKKKDLDIRTKMFIDLMEDIYNHYQKKLEKTNSIDFNDMINLAYKILCKEKIKLNYKYIIVDEYQDISLERFKLIKKISELSDSKIIAVGDDWQAIFSFAGSDVNLFTNFKKLMGSGSLLKITNTYRNSQELIDIAGKFVEKNSNQIKKKLKSPKKTTNPVIIVMYKDITKAINFCIKDIIKKYGENKKILIVARYNFEKKLLKNNFYEIGKSKFKSKKHPNLDITFLSVHSSKGLGYDNVIILNMEDSLYGFPTKIENDPIFKLIEIKKDNYSYSEERRLFYVALTRTKNHVYALAPKKNPSIFVKEISKYKNVKIKNKY